MQQKTKNITPCKIITEQSPLQLAEQDQKSLTKALIEKKVQEPTPFLTFLTEEYARKVKSKYPYPLLYS